MEIPDIHVATAFIGILDPIFSSQGQRIVRPVRFSWTEWSKIYLCNFLVIIKNQPLPTKCQKLKTPIQSTLERTLHSSLFIYLYIIRTEL